MSYKQKSTQTESCKKLGILFCLLNTLNSCGSNQTGFTGSSGRRSEDIVKATPPAEPIVEADPPAPEPPAPLPAIPAPLPVEAPPVPAPPPEQPAKLPDPVIIHQDPLKLLSWVWQCNLQGSGTPGQPPAPALALDNQVVIKGGGAHVFDKEVLIGTDVVFSGTLCTPEKAPRDMVFVVDTSGSMLNNDPVQNNSCGRLKAVQTVTGLAADGSGNFGIVTFSSNVNVFSPMLYAKPADLFAAVAPNGDNTKVLCDQGGTTNYVAGLTKAAELLAAGRPNAAKELYFISDGEPNAGDEGIDIAANLKKTGVAIGGQNIPVTIGTVMLNGTDTVLEKFIASVDSQGKPLHVFAAQADNLAAALADIATNPIVKAVLKYRSIGTNNFTEVDILKSVNGGTNFSLPPMKLSAEALANGLEVVYEYTDRRGKVVSTPGKITFTIQTSP